MSSIVPPLDYIPNLPGLGVNVVIRQFDNLIDRLIERLEQVISKVIGLPEDVDCNSELVKTLKRVLADIQKFLDMIQRNLKKIQKAIRIIREILRIAKKIKQAITAAQLLNPITAPVFIANQLMLIQDATIVNAIEALKQFKTIPSSVLSKLSALVPFTLNAIQELSNACENVPPLVVSPEIYKPKNIPGTNSNGDNSSSTLEDLPANVQLYNETTNTYLGMFNLVQKTKDSDSYWMLRIVKGETLSNAVANQLIGQKIRITCGSGQIAFAKVISINPNLQPDSFCLRTIEPLQNICTSSFPKEDYNDEVPTEFYTELNVSDEDLEFRSDTIELLLQQQQNLLTSLLEAPSKVIQGSGQPLDSIGKAGDYYVDVSTNTVYGPKISINSWT